jgi:hypothetical protein
MAWLNSGNATPEQVKEWFEKSDLKTDEEIIELVNKIIS